MLKLRRDGADRSVPGHEDVQRVPEAKREEHAERELAEQPLAPREEENRNHVHGEDEKVPEVEKREPARRRPRDHLVENERRLCAEQRDTEAVELPVERARVQERQHLAKEEVRGLDGSVDGEPV